MPAACRRHVCVTPVPIRTLRPNTRDWLLITPAVVVVLAAVGWPLLYTTLISFTSAGFTGGLQGGAFVGLRNYAETLADPGFRQAAWVTLRFVVMTVSAEMLLGVLVGLLLMQTFPGRTLLRGLLIVPWAIPTVVNAICWRLIFAPDFGAFNAALTQAGVIDEYQSWLGNPATALYAIAIADIWKNFPIVALIVLAALQTAPQDLYDAARVDGAGAWRRFRVVTFPHIAGALMVALVLRTIEAVKVFDVIWVMTRGGPFSQTKPLSMLVYEETFSFGRAGMGSSVALVITLICLVFIIAYGRLIRRQTL